MARRSVIALALVLAGTGCALAQAERTDAPPESEPAKDGAKDAAKDAPDAGAAKEAAPPSGKDASAQADVRESVCLMIESAARANALPLEFFARVIWQESRFKPDAVGPRTRSGDKAQGIAQFMPRTAAERGLLDPFDPVQALPKSAEFLHELRDQFGNLGLAAAAYNAGPQRVRNWLAGSGAMPQETRNYVVAITGRSVEEWSAALGKRLVPEPRPAPGCGTLIALVKSAPNPFVRELEQRVALGAAKAWGVQLAGGFSKDNILAAYARSMSRLGDVLAGRDPSILSTLLRNRGTRPFYQVRVGADTRAEADGLCGRIRKGGGACLVLRNDGSSG